MKQPEARFQSGPSHRIAQTPISRVEEPALNEAQVTTFLLVQKAKKLYEAQLERVGVEEFALLAYGPFSSHSQRYFAIVRVKQDILWVIDRISLQDVTHFLNQLQVGQLFEAYTYLVNEAWPHLISGRKPVKVNDTPYIPPPKPIPPRHGPTRLYVRPVPSGPANTAAILSISARNTCILSKPLLLALNLSGGRRVHLVVPTERNGEWYLDTNPKPGVGSSIPLRGRATFRLPPLHRYHFQVSRPTFEQRGGRGGLKGTGMTNSLRSLLHFHLGPEVPGHKGYYYLLRGLPTTQGG